MEKKQFFNPSNDTEATIYYATTRRNRLHAVSYKDIYKALKAVTQWYAAQLAPEVDSQPGGHETRADGEPDGEGEYAS